MDAKKAAAAYPTLEKLIARVLIERDPSGLYAMGAPHDEHDGDVHSILVDRLCGWIVDAGKDVEDLCSGMAPAIWEAWREFKRAAG
jgi:hypothetical protein